MSDLDALVALERHFFEADRISKRSFRRFISAPKATLFVVEVDGKVAGCALVLYRRNSKRARLYTIAIAIEFQRRGMARQLLAACEQNARRRGCRFMRLEVREDDAGAIRLYETSGYRRFGRRVRYYGNSIDALRFEKQLNPGPRRRLIVTAKKTDLRARIGFHGGHRGPRSRNSVRSRL